MNGDSKTPGQDEEEILPEDEGIKEQYYQIHRKRDKTYQDMSKYAALTSTPYIIIGYPLVGFGLGYIFVHFLHWPIWFPVITLMLGFVQGIREVIKIGKNIDEES